MNIKPFKFKLICCLTTSIFLLSTVPVYSAPQQQDQRGFPRAQSSGPRQPNMNRQNFQNKQNFQNRQNPVINQNQNMQWKKNPNQNQNQNQWNKKKNEWKKHHHDDGHRHHDNRFFYYNTYYPYPYFYNYYPSYPSYDDSYNYSTPSNYSQQNTYNYQSSDFSYDPSSLPEGVWGPASGGGVPDKAYVYQINNGEPIYYCRVQYKYTTYYGVLTPEVGCYVKDQASILRFDQYEVLISY